MITDEWIEAAARAICARNFPAPDAKPENSPYPSAWERYGTEYRKDARAALEAVAPMIRDAALEEAAKVADGYGWPPDGRAVSVRLEAAYDRADEVAAAIRALKETDR